MALCSFADRSHWYGKSFGGGYLHGKPYFRIVWHTTETTGRPTYSGGAVAPHFTVDPVSGKVWQHYGTNRPARALEHRRGTIDTNNMWAIQIEVIAYSDKAVSKRVPGGGLWVGDFTDKHYAVLRKLARWIEAHHAVKAAHPYPTKAYPASYGDHNGNRIPDGKWRTFNGHCEHQNVPHNNHGDAGSLDLARLMPPKKPTPKPTPKPKPTVPVFKTTNGGDPMQIVREQGSPHCFLANGIQRRHLVGGTDVKVAQARLKAAKQSPDIVEIPAGTLAQHGVLIEPATTTPEA